MHSSDSQEAKVRMTLSLLPSNFKPELPKRLAVAKNNERANQTNTQHYNTYNGTCELEALETEDSVRIKLDADENGQTCWCVRPI